VFDAPIRLPDWNDLDMIGRSTAGYCFAMVSSISERLSIAPRSLPFVTQRTS
jgi:hypothetical protein